MKFYRSFLFLTLVACLSVTSCYHILPTGGGGGGGNNKGSTFLNVTVTSTPSTTFSFPSLTWQIGNLILTDSAGASLSIAGGSAAPFLDFARLQTDSAYLGHVFVPSTSFTKLQVQFNTPPLFSYFYNSSNATLLGCAPATVCRIPSTVPGFGAATINVPVSFAVAANTNTGIRINFDLSKAVTSASGMTFDFTQTGAITVALLPPASSQTTGLDTIDNATGAVTAISGTSLTIQNFSQGPVTYTVAANATFVDDLFSPSICPAPASLSCLAVGQNISIDGVIASDGTRTAEQIEFLDPAPAVNELEGVIISPVANNQFKMVLTNGMGSNILIVSSPVLVNLNGKETYLIDTKNLQTPTSQTGFLSQSDLVVGQSVMVQGGTFSGNNTSITNPTRVLLRYSSIGGSLQSLASPNFTLSGVSPFLSNLTNNTVQVETFQTTAFDNVSGGLSGLATGATISVRGLYLNPNSGATQPVLAAKVRKH